MTEYVTMRCPEGGWDYPISHGTRSFYPYRADIHSEDPREFGGPWLVDIPIDVAHHFIGRAGFVLMSEEQKGEIPETVRLRSPTGQGCVWGDPSKTYEPDADGVVTVPYAALSDLYAHGFVVVTDEPKAAPIKAEPKAKEPEEDEAEHTRDPRGGRVPRR